MFTTELDDANGCSFVYEEHKGDYAEAARIADELLDGADADPSADTWAAAGTLKMLQGHVDSANQRFQQAIDGYPSPETRARGRRE